MWNMDETSFQLEHRPVADHTHIYIYIPCGQTELRENFKIRASQIISGPVKTGKIKLIARPGLHIL